MSPSAQGSAGTTHPWESPPERWAGPGLGRHPGRRPWEGACVWAGCERSAPKSSTQDTGRLLRRGPQHLSEIRTTAGPARSGGLAARLLDSQWGDILTPRNACLSAVDAPRSPSPSLQPTPSLRPPAAGSGQDGFRLPGPRDTHEEGLGSPCLCGGLYLAASLEESFTHPTVPAQTPSCQAPDPGASLESSWPSAVAPGAHPSRDLPPQPPSPSQRHPS